MVLSVNLSKITTHFIQQQAPTIYRTGSTAIVQKFTAPEKSLHRILRKIVICA